MRENGFLIDPPEPGADVRGLVCLDFDGVLNRISIDHRDKLPQVTKDGRLWGIDLDTAVLALMDAIVQHPKIWLAWVTTWGPQISLVRPLFNGHLAGGFVVAERPQGVYVDIGWKEKLVLRLAEQFPDAKLVWIDDTAVTESFRYGGATRRLPDALLIAPNPAIGIQASEIAMIEAFFEVITSDQA